MTYDKAGNLKTDQVGSAFIYDAENRQVTAAVAGQSTTYIYDGDGHRIKKVTVAATTVFVYNLMGQLVAEYSSAPPPPSGTKKYLVADHLGTPRVITDATGTVLSRHDYLPFGEELFAGIGSRTTPSEVALGPGDNKCGEYQKGCQFMEPKAESVLCGVMDMFQARMNGRAEGCKISLA